MKFKTKTISLMSILFLLVSLLFGCAQGNNDTDDEAKNDDKPKDLILATTTSTQDSGLLDVLIPDFEEQYNANVKTIAVGTGKALQMGKDGEADVLLVHAPDAEMELVESEDAINRQRVMYNDFIIVGPSSDPAGIKGLTVTEAFTKISESESIFVSRGDDSGTHKKELQLWETANLDPKANSAYMEAGQGMGATIKIAAEKEGYVLTDRATYLAQQKNYEDISILVEGDETLLNIYHVMQVNPEKHEKVNSESAEDFVEFMIADDTQSVIEKFGVDEYDQPLFFPYTE